MVWQLILIWTSLNAREHCKKNPHDPFNWKFTIYRWNWHGNSASGHVDIKRSGIFRSKKERTKNSDQLSNIMTPKLGIRSTGGKRNKMLCCISFHMILIVKINKGHLNIMPPRWILALLFVLLKHESRWTETICKFMNSSIFTQKLQVVQIPKAGNLLLRA